MEKKYARGEFDPWAPNDGLEPLTITEAKKRFLKAKEHLRPKSQEAYAEVIRNLIRRLPPGLLLRDLAPEHLLEYVRNDSSVSVATLRKRYRHLKAFLRHALKQGYLDKNPIEDVQPPKPEKKVPAFLMPDQLERLLRAIDADFELKYADDQARPGQIQWLKDLIILAVNTGCRLSELTGLRWSAVNFATGFLTVGKHTRTKSGHERSIPLTQDALEVLTRLDAEREGDGDDYVLKGYTGGQLNPNYASKRFKYYVRLAKLPEEIHFHSLRHTTASWLAMKGVPLRVIQAILGHSTLGVTEKYSHLTPDVMKAAMQETFDQ